MPSGLSDAIVDAVLDGLLGASAGSILNATLYLDLNTTSPSDDNGTGVVSWGQGRTSVATVNGTNWPAAAGRTKTGASFVMPTNSSGASIDCTSFSWWTASSGGTYRGGGPLPGGTLTVPNGTAPIITPSLSAPSPS